MRNVYIVVWPFYFVTKSLGLFPMSFDGSPEKGNLVVKWHDFIAPAFNFILAVVIFVTPLRILYSETVNGLLPWIATVMTLVCLSGSALNFIPYFHQISKRKSIAEFLHGLHSFDKKVEFSLNLIMKETFFIQFTGKVFETFSISQPAQKFCL